jgi:hypothetical protein
MRSAYQWNSVSVAESSSPLTACGMHAALVQGACHSARLSCISQGLHAASVVDDEQEEKERLAHPSDL